MSATQSQHVEWGKQYLKINHVILQNHSSQALALQIENKDALNCYYAHSEAKEALQVTFIYLNCPFQGEKTPWITQIIILNPWTIQI